MRLTTLSLVLLLGLTAVITGCKAPQNGGSAAGAGASADAAKSDGKAEAGKAAASTADKKDDDKKDDKDKSDAEKKEEKEKKEKEDKIKKYDELVGDDDLTTSEGLFKVSMKADKLYLHLDDDSLGREFLYNAALNSGVGSSSLYRGALLYETDQVLHFEKATDEKITLVANPTRWLDPGDTFDEKRLSQSVSPSVLNSFDIAAEQPDEKRYVIDLGSWFLGDNLDLAKMMSGKYSASKDLSRFKLADAFPKNVELGVEMVYTGSGGNLTIADGNSFRLNVRHSFSALPEPGFKPRLYDQRVGYFTTERKDMFDWQSKDAVRRFANRWRLQKKDPTADVSDPVKPITYWVENSTPAAFREAVKKGIEAWEPAFRKAGFSNGIVAKIMPADAEWDPADVRYAVVRWSTDDIGFAIGPSRVDPRTGEIFDADITMQESFLSSYARRFDTYVEDLAGMSKAELKQTAEKLYGGFTPEDLENASRLCSLTSANRALEVARVSAMASILLPDFDKQEFLEAMITDVVMHEVGHTLGLRHNFKSSVWNDIARANDVAFTSERGLAGSVMDYNAINLAAPGRTQGEFFPSVPGPYDYWAIEYGYTEINGSNQEATLNSIASRSGEHGLEYGTDEDMILGDPLCITWDFGTDPVSFAADQIALAEEGLRRLVDKGADTGDDYYQYARFYSMFAGLHARSVQPLTRYLGGFTMTRDKVGQVGGKPPMIAVDAGMQAQALDLMISKGLKWTGGIPDAERLLLANKKVGSWGSWFDPWDFDTVPRIVNSSRYVMLTGLLSNNLHERIANQGRMGVTGAPTSRDVATRTFEAVWPATPDEHDRWTQKDFIEIVISNLGRDTTPDVTALMDTLLSRAQTTAQRYASAGDPAVAAHGQWLDGHIERFRQRQVVESF